MKHLRKFLSIGLLLTTILFTVKAQYVDSEFFQSPLNIPLLLSGNYGELRTNHFHAGIDFKTYGEIGKEVLAAADGYVSRIKIQSGGYGKSIYITHANGFTTVYGHLNQYIPSINEYVKTSQYQKHAYEVDLYPPINKFSFKKGGLIAYSGNTGGSGGPHLHFEIRKTKEEIPMNGLLFKLPVEDVRSPEFKSLYVYSLPENESVGNNGESRASYHVSKINNSVYEINRLIKCKTNFIGFAVEGYDFLNTSSNKCGIFNLELRIDGNILFAFTIDNISFDQTRYINAHMDYELKINENTGVHRLFRLPNNMLGIYNNIYNNGIYEFSDDSIHEVEIMAKDVYGNKSILRSKIQRVKPTSVQQNKTDSLRLVKFDHENIFQLSALKIIIPAKSLYRNIFFSLSSLKAQNRSFSDTFNIHLRTESLHSGMVLKYKTDSIDPDLATKLLFARIDGTRIISEGGEWSQGLLSTTAKNFGKYFITVDTSAPEIRSINLSNGEKFGPGQQIAFRVNDNLSGIKTYNLYINDKWALLEYDPKTERMFYNIDDKLLIAGNIYRLKLYVMDERNNIAVFESKFLY